MTSGADLDLRFVAIGGRTALARRRCRYPYAMTGVFPAADGALMVTPQCVSGGLFSGDDLTERVGAEADSIAVVREQGARVTHAARGGGTARLTRRLSADGDSALHWFGQPTVLLPGASAALETGIVLDDAALVTVSELTGAALPAGYDAAPAQLRARLTIDAPYDAGPLAEMALETGLTPERGWFGTLLVIGDGVADPLSGHALPDDVGAGSDRLPGGIGWVVQAAGPHAGELTELLHRLQSPWAATALLRAAG